MKHFKHHSLAILPLFAILTISPAELQKYSEGRSVASIEVEKENGIENPRYEALVSKLDRSAILKKENVDIEKFMTELSELQKKVEVEHGEFKSPLDVKSEVVEQRQTLESLVIKVVLAEDDLQVLQEKKLLVPEKEAEILEQISKTKSNLESLLTCLEGNEQLVAEAEGKDQDSKQDVVADDDSKETEPKQDVVAEDDSKKEEDTQKEEESKPEVAKDEECKDDKYAELTKQIEALVSQQNDILQTMLNMNTTMMAMMQQQQQNQWNPYMYGPLVPYAHMYQYGSSNSNGAWVYMPNGFNPAQLAPSMGGLYPDQIQPQQNSWMQPQQSAAPAWNGWGLSNQYQFQPDPRYQVPGQLVGGNFGHGMDNFGFNLGMNTPTLM